MTAAYAGSMEVHSRNNILTNIMRAAFDMPMTFTDIPTVLGQGLTQGQAGLTGNIMSMDPSTLAGFFSAAPQSNATLQAGLTVSRQFSFTLSSLDNQQFTKGFLTPVSLDNVHFFAKSSQLSKDLLFSILVYSMEYTSRANQPRSFITIQLIPITQNMKRSLIRFLISGLPLKLSLSLLILGPS